MLSEKQGITIICCSYIHEFGFRVARNTENAKFRNEDDEEQGWVDYLSKQASSYLPAQMNDLWMRGKSFATARLPSIGKRNTVALPL